MERRSFLLMGSVAMLSPLPAFARGNEQFDVVVIGAGGAGLSAAIAAADAGARVVVLEKMPIIGGNTRLAAGGMNVARHGRAGDQRHQRRLEWRWMTTTMKGGGDRDRPRSRRGS